MSPTTILAESNGYLLARQGPVLMFADRGTRVVSMRAFVVALLFFLIVANVVAQLFLLVLGGAPTVGLPLVMLGVTAALFGGGAWRIRAILKHRRALPPESVSSLLLIDLEEHTLLDADGTMLSPLAEVKFQHQLLPTSPNRSLAAQWPGGSRQVFVGNMFRGSVSSIESALRAEGLM
jgi:hypothetical protein